MITLSQKLARAVSDAAFDCLSGKLTLEQNEIETLSQILAAKEETDIPVNRKRALNAFAQAATPATSADVLGKILLDANEAESTRLAAASSLGRIPGSASEAALVRALAKADARLRQEVVKALGRVGSEKGLAALEDLAEPEDGRAIRLLAFSKILIASRTGKAALDPGLARRDLGVEWRKQPARKLAKAKLKEHIEALHGHTFGLELNHDLGFEFECAKATHALLLNASISASNLPKSLMGQPQVSAIVTLRNPRELRSTVRHVVLTSPTETGLDIVVTRTTGEVVYAGEAKRDGNVWRLALRDTGDTTSPTMVTGTLSAKGIELEISTLERQRVRAGQRVAIEAMTRN